ncbi:MAG: DUF4270 family protein [Chitinophagaceae bacterium]
MRNFPGFLKFGSLAFTAFFLLFFSIGCQKTEINYGQQYLDAGISNIILVDSLTPSVSTIYKDSVITSQSGTILAGSYTDPYFGKTSTNSYLQLSTTSLADVLNNAQYDSLVLLMKCNGSFYGDTTLPITLSVTQLSQELKFAETQSYFYNINTWPANATPLGTRTFQLRPLAGDSANVKLDDAKGQELFNMIRLKDPILKDNALFTNYFKGLKVSATTNNNIYSFKDSVIMRLYYHQTDITLDNKYFDFAFSNKPLQFNNITADRSGTPLTALNTLNNELPSTASNNIGYLQSATGLYLKVSFPTIRKLLERSDYIKILRAQLVIKPIQQSFSNYFSLPSQLYAAETDGANEPGANITSVVSGASSTETGNLSIDDVYGTNTNYSYDVTSYLQTEILNAAINKDGLLLIPPTGTRFSAMNRLVIGNSQNANGKIQLNVYYISVNK